ncbi:MFS transporter [Vagococcus coleopterorum]|uniref:MFS transporter n=1 Tax=Vagococcus coleopterorum TaxID=2714946 RepID=A0A6G8AME0_9ENTE|nr:MFS transporter [Vagococcus coleopterorum]QIL46228.1 MFS transporter [Vagococcus coleopterorum]
MTVKQKKLLTGIVLSVLTFWLFAQAITVGVPNIIESLGISAESVNFGLSLTALFSGIFITVAGGFADKIGRLKITYLGIILSIVSSVILLLANGETLFVIGRIISGISAACIMPATMGLLKDNFEGEDRQRAVTWWSIGSWGGTALSGLIGGVLVQAFGWKAIFMVSIIVSLVSLALIYGTKEKNIAASKSDVRFDFLGLITFIILMLSINLFITKGAEFGWLSAKTIGLLAVFLASAFVFSKIEAKHKEPLVDFSLFKDSNFFGATISNFLMNGITGASAILSIYLQGETRGLSSSQVGLISVGYLVSIIISIMAGEKLLKSGGAKRPMMLGPVISASGIVLMALTFIPGAPYLVLTFLGLAILGIGQGMYATPSTDMVLESAPADKVGVASGLYKMASALGGSFGMAITLAVYTALGKTSNLNTAAGLGFLVNVLFLVLALVVVSKCITDKKAPTKSAVESIVETKEKAK